MFQLQKTHIQGTEAPHHSHSMVKLRNAEDEFSGRNPVGAGLCAPWVFVAYRSWGITPRHSSRLAQNAQRHRHGQNRLNRRFLNDLMFGLVADDELYLKTDKASSPQFDELGLMPFQYNKNGKLYNMSYYLAPEGIYDDADEALRWANIAYDAALRANKGKTKK